MQALISLGIFALLLPIYTSRSDSPFIPQIVHAQEVSQETASSSVPELIEQYAAEYGVSSSTMYSVVNCETGGTFDPSIQSFIANKSGPNGREDSWGLSQIHLPDWPNITKSQAQDQNFALNFLASKLKIGKGGYWSCYRSQHSIELKH